MEARRAGGQRRRGSPCQCDPGRPGPRPTLAAWAQGSRSASLRCPQSVAKHRSTATSAKERQLYGSLVPGVGEGDAGRPSPALMRTTSIAHVPAVAWSAQLGQNRCQMQWQPPFGTLAASQTATAASTRRSLRWARLPVQLFAFQPPGPYSLMLQSLRSGLTHGAAALLVSLGPSSPLATGLLWAAWISCHPCGLRLEQMPAYCGKIPNHAHSLYHDQLV